MKMKDQNTIIQESLMARIRELEYEVKIRDIAVEKCLIFISDIDANKGSSTPDREQFKFADKQIRNFCEFLAEYSGYLIEGDEIHADSKVAFDAEAYLNAEISKYTDWQNSILRHYALRRKELRTHEKELAKNNLYSAYDLINYPDEKFLSLSEDAQEAVKKFLANHNLRLGMTEYEIARYLNETK